MKQMVFCGNKTVCAASLKNVVNILVT